MPIGAFKLNSIARYRVPAASGRSTLTAFGNAQVDTAQFKFGSAAALFDGTGDYIDVTNTVSGGTGDFTLEFWVRWSTIPVARNGSAWQMAFTNPLAATGSYLLLWSDSAQIAMGDKYAHFDYGSAVVANTWYHFAVVRQSGDTFLYFNGSKKTFIDDVPGGGQSWLNRSTTLDWLPAAGYRLGAYTTGNKGIIGHMDEIRVSKTARYTANFTPSASAFVNDANTCLLMHCEGTDASTTFTDDNA